MMVQEVNFLQARFLPRRRRVWPWLAGAVVLPVVAALWWQWARVQRLEVEVMALQQDWERRQAISGAPWQAAGTEQGFVQYFQAFAQGVESGLWLTRMTVTAAGQRVVLEGRTLATEKILQFLERLNRQAPFAGGWTFQSLSVTPVAEENGLYLFQVRGEPR